MAGKRSYQDSCGTAHALDLVGERWALLVVRELLLGPKRYSDLLADLPGISTNVLSTRLTELEHGGVLERRRLAPPAAARVYELTDWGRELEPIVLNLGRWGAGSPGHRRDAHLSVSSLMLSLRSNFDAGAAQGHRGVYELHIGQESFDIRIDPSGLHIDRSARWSSAAGSTAGPDGGAGGPTAIHSEVRPLAGVVYGGRPLREAVLAGDVEVTGDLSAVERLLACFSLPPTASGPSETAARGA